MQEANLEEAIEGHFLQILPQRVSQRECRLVELHLHTKAFKELAADSQCSKSRISS